MPPPAVRCGRERLLRHHRQERGDDHLPADGITAAQEATLAAAAENTVVTHATIVHYTAPFASVVQRRTMQPQAEFWFMSSGTSSEDLWYDRMNEIFRSSE